MGRGFVSDGRCLIAVDLKLTIDGRLLFISGADGLVSGVYWSDSYTVAMSLSRSLSLSLSVSLSFLSSR